jgi:hypothetical protein
MGRYIKDTETGAYEEIFSRTYALADGAADTLACTGLIVVLLHGSGVDAAEAGLYSLINEIGGALLLPSGAVHHRRHLRGGLGSCHGVAFEWGQGLMKGLVK